MAFSSTATSVTYEGNGSTVTPYVIPFAFLDTDHISVVVGGETDPPAPPEGQSFTVTRNSDGQGGYVTSEPAVTSMSTVTISRVTPLVQPAVFAVNGPFPAKTAETSHDREVMQIQEIDSRVTKLDADLLAAIERIVALEGGIVVTPTAPVNSTLPIISGQAVVGSVITCSTGIWSGSPTGYSYQWCKDGVEISGATLAAYTILIGDIGGALACKVTATNSTGSTVAVSASVVAAAAPASSERYYGYAALTSLNEAQILAFASIPGTNRSMSFTVAGGGNYIYVAIPVSFGDFTSALLTGSTLNQIGNFIKNPVSGTPTTVNGVSYNVFRSEYTQAAASMIWTFS